MATTQALAVTSRGTLTVQQDRFALTPLGLAAIGAWWAMWLLPVGLATIMIAASLLVVTAAVPSSTVLRGFLDERRAASAKQARRDARDNRLSPASFGHTTLAELTRLVDQVVETDPLLAARFDLETLLDRHVTLTIAYERALRAVQMADRDRLERIRDACKAEPRTSSARLELCERRLHSLRECEVRADTLADELAVLKDLVSLIAQRAAIREDIPADDIVERQLEELDDAEAARRQVAELR
jgi:hypothetical protein